MFVLEIDGRTCFASQARLLLLVDIARQIDREFTIARNLCGVNQAAPETAQRLGDWLDGSLDETETAGNP